MRKFVTLLLCLSLVVSQLWAQNRTLKGKVTDDKGVGIPQASVLVKGTTVGTTTAADGSFSISIPATGKTLVVSSLNFSPQEVSITGKTAVTVSLTSSSQNLEEVVVVGYGTQRKSEVTSSISKVSGDQVANTPLSSVDQALQGKAAGVQSVTFSGQPGANQAIRIRGIGSYSASAQPLFVVDGIQINSGDLSRETTTTNVLAQLNPDDVESISILKDASATSIYGARGANGVIVITTKGGKAGKTKFNVSTEVGNNKPGDLPAAGIPLRANDWLTLYKEGYTNYRLIAGDPLATAQASAATIAATYGDGSVDINWPALLLRTGTQQLYNINASGGDAKTTFFISGGYFKQEASTIGSDLARYSSVININHIISPKIDVSFSLQPTYTKQNTAISNSSAFASPTMEFYFLRPTSNPFNADGSYNIDRVSNKNFSNNYNPLYIVAKDIHSLDNFSMLGKAAGNYKILNNLKFTTSMGLQYNNLEEFQYNNQYHGDGASSNGRGYAYYTRYLLWDWTSQLNYHAALTRNKYLTLDATAGYESINSRGYFITASSINYPTPALVDAANAATVTAGSNNGSDYNFASEFARASFNYKGKYTLAGSFRRDGSSRFAASNAYGNFPSISGAWIVTKENFMANVKAISDLKLKASYGSSGNAEVGNYAWRQTFGFGANYNNQPGGVFNGIGNANLQWEHALMTDFGVDVSFFKNRLSLVVDYYIKKSDQLLFAQPLSLTTGFSTITKNIGAMENKGIEITINATPVSTRNFTWDVSLNFTNNKNTVTQLPPGQTQIINGVQYVAPGHDIYEFYGKLWGGVDPATGNPQWFTDATKSAKTFQYSAAANTPMGLSASPKYYGGFTNTITYKQFSLAADLYYNFGNYVRDSWAGYLTDEVNSAYGKYAYTLNRWQKPGDITDVPRLIAGSTNTSSTITNSNSISFSSRFLYKGDFLRLRNITLSYTANQSLVKKLHVTSLKFYARGSNLWTKIYDSRIPFDPEQGITSQTNLNVLYNKAVTVGLNIGF
jgi:TonB-linked SusC/RagA family outer membrane protein